MDNKIIDMNEWVRWVLEQHPSQNQITTIKKFWKCHKLEDYEKYSKIKLNMNIVIGGTEMIIQMNG